MTKKDVDPLAAVDRSAPPLVPHEDEERFFSTGLLTKSDNAGVENDKTSLISNGRLVRSSARVSHLLRSSTSVCVPTETDDLTTDEEEDRD